MDFIALITQHIPPKGKQYIRRYGLYSSRTRGVWERSPFVVKLAPKLWKEAHTAQANGEGKAKRDEEKGKGEEAPNKYNTKLHLGLVAS